MLIFMTNNYLLGFIGFSGVSQVLSAIIASERCFCILQPLRSQTVLLTSIMTATIVAVNVVVVASYFLMLARYNVVCAHNPVTDSGLVKTVVGSEFLSSAPEDLGRSHHFCLRRRLPSHRDGGGDDDDDNNGDETSSGCCLEGRHVVHSQRVSTRDRSHQDARLQLRLLHRLRLSHRLV